jgi:hypothetical protein
MLGFDGRTPFCDVRMGYIFMSVGLEEVVWVEVIVLKARIVCRFAGAVCQDNLGSRNLGSICAEFKPALAIEI